MSVFGQTGAMLAAFVPDFLETWFEYIPDKTLSIAFALSVLRWGFPLFERQLILQGDFNRDNWTSPAIFGMIYIPSFVRLMQLTIYKSGTFGWLWCLPLILAIIGVWRSWSKRSLAATDRSERLKHYIQSLAIVDVTNNLFSRL